MTVTFSERDAIQRMMSYIEEERARLWGDYKNLLERLGQLDEIDRPLEAAPIEEETEPVVEVPEESMKQNMVSAPIIPMVVPEKSLADVIAELNQEAKEEAPRFRKEVEELKDKEYKNRKIKNPTRGGGSADIAVVAQFAKAILKEAGEPIKTSELIQKLREADIKMWSPYSILNQIRKYDQNIENVERGYYQYKG